MLSEDSEKEEYCQLGGKSILVEERNAMSCNVLSVRLAAKEVPWIKL